MSGMSLVKSKRGISYTTGKNFGREGRSEERERCACRGACSDPYYLVVQAHGFEDKRLHHVGLVGMLRGKRPVKHLALECHNRLHIRKVLPHSILVGRGRTREVEGSGDW